MRTSVPPQVCSTSSGCAAMARISSGFSIAADPVFTSCHISSVPTAVARFGGQQKNQTHPGQKTADVREVSHIAALPGLRIGDGAEAAEKLDREPIQKQNKRRH